MTCIKGAAWGRDLRDIPIRGITKYKELIKKIVPRPYGMGRFIQQIRSSRGVGKFGINLYHGPNFLAFRFDDPIITTVHDLSFLRYPETHPKIRVVLMNELLPDAISRLTQILTDFEFVKQESCPFLHQGG